MLGLTQAVLTLPEQLQVRLLTIEAAVFTTQLGVQSSPVALQP